MAASYTEWESPTESHQTPTRHWPWWIYPGNQIRDVSGGAVRLLLWIYQMELFALIDLFFFAGDILTYHSSESTGVNNKKNEGWNPFSCFSFRSLVMMHSDSLSCSLLTYWNSKSLLKAIWGISCLLLSFLLSQCINFKTTCTFLLRVWPRTHDIQSGVSFKIEQLMF